MENRQSWLMLIIMTALLVCAGQDCDLTINLPGGDGPGNGNGNGVQDPPVFAVAPADLVLDCSIDDVVGELEDWLASAEADADEDCGDVTVTHDFALSDDCDENGWVTTVTWTAEDECGQTVTTSATLTLLNPDPPVITLNGDDPVIVEVGVGTYDEPGATATLGCGAATASADVGGDVVDVNVLGTYTVTYDLTDACGQAADQVTRTVHVVAPPEFTTFPMDLTLDCSEDGAADALAVWLDSAVAEADAVCGDVTITSEILGLANDCEDEGWTLVVEWTATDECDLSSTVMANLTLVSPENVTITLVGDEEITLECGLDEYTELGAIAAFGCDDITVPVATGGDAVDVHMPGTYTVTYGLSDSCGHAAGPVTRTVTVLDTQGPVIEPGPMLELWPVNHGYETLSLSDCVQSAEDACEGDIDVDEMGTILSIYSDEPEDGLGDGNTEEDIVILDASSFMLRAERQGGGNGRVYGIDFEITDSEGNTTAGTCFVGVPHDQSGDLAIDDGPEYTVTP
jgi:hypothetical protein